MLPWPTVLPVQVQPAVWTPSPAQQIACLRKGIGLQAALGGWLATYGGDSRTVRSWDEVREFAAVHGVRLGP